ncbi:VCBS repeat-containing protein [Kribbella sp. NBC_01505]|uniref:FG-GAP repeat domain-containing protein n=1 Tax=Kribbella sp. NBC_01505 TaxID=2903580 RepID=UPI00386DA1F1
MTIHKTIRIFILTLLVCSFGLISSGTAQARIPDSMKPSCEDIWDDTECAMCLQNQNAFDASMDLIRNGEWWALSTAVFHARRWHQANGAGGDQPSCQESFGGLAARSADDGGGGLDTRPSLWGDISGLQGSRVLSGDFDADGRDDLVVARIGGDTLPVAFSSGDGEFDRRSWSHPFLSTALGDAKADATVGDFNGDGKDDVAFLGGTGWTSVMVNLSSSYRDMTEPQHLTGGRPGKARKAATVVTPPTAPGFPVPVFTPVYWNNPSFASITDPLARPVAGDFDGDGDDDLAIAGLPGSMPLAMSNGDGSFTMTSNPIRSAPGTSCPVVQGPAGNCLAYLQWSRSPGAQVVVADFDGDHDDDIALAGGRGWESVPVAYPTSLGCQFACAREFLGFSVTNQATGFAERADDIEGPLNRPATVKIVAGDFNSDGRADLAAFGTHWQTEEIYPFLPMALSQADQTLGKFEAFTATSNEAQLTSLIGALGVKTAIGDFNGDGKEDISHSGGMNFVGLALTGGTDTYTITDKYIS